MRHANERKTSEGESRRRLIDNYVNNGLQALNEKLALQSLPWLSEAIALERDKDRLRIHQWRFNIALQQAPKPEQTWIRDASVEGCKTVGRWQADPKLLGRSHD